MIRALARAVAVLAAAVLTAAGVVTLAAAPASAARDLGGVMWNDTKGNAQTLLKIYSEGPCPAEAKYVKATARGHGFPAKGQTIVAPSELLISRDKSMGLSVSNAFQIFGEENRTALVGRYDITIACTDRFGMRSVGDFTSSMVWKTPGNKASNVDRATFVAKNTAVVDPATDVFVPDGDLFAQSLAQDGAEPPPSPNATPKDVEPTSTGSAAPTASAGPTPTITATGSGGGTAAADAAPSDGASSSSARLLWIGVAAALLLVAGVLWFRSGRRSAD